MSRSYLVDVHTHVNFNAFRQDGPAVAGRALERSIWMILVGSQIDTSRRALEYAGQYSQGVYAAVGLHPIHLVETEVDRDEMNAAEGVPGFTTRKEEFDYNTYRVLAHDPKTVAIGECGLDYYRLRDTEDIKQKQAETFRKQIALAREVKKPLMIHCRNAYEDLLAILREEKADEIGGDIHFFAGDWNTAKQFLDFGFYLSFTGVITFANQYDEVIKNAPLGRIMTETDAPYVAPVPYRGKRNEPLYVEEVARRIAEIKGLSLEEVARATSENAMRLFNLS
jgi:TatD DNase family protein